MLCYPSCFLSSMSLMSEPAYTACVLRAALLKSLLQVGKNSMVAFAGLRIQRMPSEPDTEFGIPANYPYMCVASPSCHDTSTTRAWYEEDPDRRQRFYNVRPLM